jgi:hypothetical protein
VEKGMEILKEKAECCELDKGDWEGLMERKAAYSTD